MQGAYSTGVGSSAGNLGYASEPPKLTKQQMLAQLKEKAERRRQENGAEPASATLETIESSTDPVVARITSANRPLKTAGTAIGFLSALGRRAEPQAHLKTETVSMRPFATIADPLVLAEADMTTNEAVYQMEMNQVPSSGEERDRYEHFKQICSQYDIPAGMMQLLWRHLENDFTVIDMDTSLSMNTIDEQNPLEQQQNVEIMQFGENAKNTPYSQPRSRMVEAKERLQEILPLLFAANRRGVVHLKTLSDQAGKQLDMRHITYDQAMQLGSAFVNAIRANLSFTPSVNSYLNSCQMACDMRHSGRVQSATIVNFSDGEPNQKTDPRVEQIYQNYVNTVLRHRGDYQRVDGSIVPYALAAKWNMDANTPELMRRLSVLAGHFNVPTTIAACTNDEYAMGEQGELDELHMNVAVLDDFQSEQSEVLRQQGLRFPFNKSMYLALNFIAPKETAFDLIDERPLNPEELTSVLGYYPGYDAYMQNLETSMTAVEATMEIPQPSAPPAYF